MSLHALSLVYVRTILDVEVIVQDWRALWIVCSCFGAVGAKGDRIAEDVDNIVDGGLRREGLVDFEDIGAARSDLCAAAERVERIADVHIQAGLLYDGEVLQPGVHGGGDGVWCDSEGIDEERRSEEHTSELQSLMRISYAVF